MISSLPVAALSRVLSGSTSSSPKLGFMTLLTTSRLQQCEA
eukprot:CAMPEP_0170617726 /NCGR_PEP_ID=MMETSP0224-20130122/26577_1 /TAXON_ID=285029 /ORGANISM="Togula jolla, Strain CCCM 725" /LENGTH=40 /DNA_ID= /DNA_START= /DNA_END= /DNA_ORIENTATION=